MKRPVHRGHRVRGSGQQNLMKRENFFINDKKRLLSTHFVCRLDDVFFIIFKTRCPATRLKPTKHSVQDFQTVQYEAGKAVGKGAVVSLNRVEMWSLLVSLPLPCPSICFVSILARAMLLYLFLATAIFSP